MTGNAAFTGIQMTTLVAIHGVVCMTAMRTSLTPVCVLTTVTIVTVDTEHTLTAVIAPTQIKAIGVTPV